MIDVPVEVKDALREGTYKKNYRFVIPAEDIPEGFYEIAKITENQKIQLPHAGTYKFFGKGENAWTGVTTWENWEPGSELEWLPASTTSPNTELTSYMDADIVSVSGFNGIDFVSLMEWREASHEDSIVIDNNNLVSESVSIDERMCSGDTLKFGLCEGSSIEFQYFDKPNITGRRVQVFVDVQYRAGIMGHIDASNNFTVPVNGSYIFEIKKGSVTGLYITYASGGDMYVDFVLGQTIDTEELEAGDVVTLNNPSSDALFEVSTDMWYTIPMGFFDVEKCSRQASTGIIKVTAYNKLQSDYLDAKANLMIEEIAVQGEPGYSDTVSIRTILDALLGDYSISVKPNFVYSVNAFANYLYPGFRALTRLTSQGGNSGYYLTEYKFAREFQLEEENFNADDYYRVTIKAKALADKFNEICAAFRLDGQGVEYKYYNGDLPSGQSSNGFTFDRLMELYPGDFSLAITNNTPTTIVSVPLYNNTSSEIITSWFSNVSRHDAIRVYIPIYLIFETTYRTSMSTAMPSYLASLYDALIASIPNCIIVEKRNLSEMEKRKYSLNDINDWADVTLRELQSAVYETQCQYGQLDRETDLFSGVELNHSRLYPADSLYPATDLYPDGAALSGFKSMYSKLWADEGNIHKWRYLIITYKGLDGEGNEQDYTLQRTVNTDGTDDYNMSDNWLFRNLVWTAEQVAEYAEAMVAKMRDMTWFPFEMWCAGLPYLETGDEIEIPLNGESYTSYILQRQLKGIQNLQDTYINGTLDIF